MLRCTFIGVSVFSMLKREMVSWLLATVFLLRLSGNMLLSLLSHKAKRECLPRGKYIHGLDSTHAT